MSALVPSSTSHLNSPSFEGSTFVQDDVPLEDSIPPQLQSREWLADASLPLLVKRAIDLTGALVGLTLLTPVILDHRFAYSSRRPWAHPFPAVAAWISWQALPSNQVPHDVRRRRTTLRCT